MRAVLSATMVVLVVLALLAGNCFSCPQMLLALGTHQTHGCCPHDKAPQKQDCRTQALRQFVKADTGAVIVLSRPPQLSVTTQTQPVIAAPAENFTQFSPLAPIPIRV